MTEAEKDLMDRIRAGRERLVSPPPPAEEGNDTGYECTDNVIPFPPERWVETGA